MKVQENQERLKLNRAYQLLVCADDVHLLKDNTDTIKKNTQTLIGASKEDGLEVNSEKNKHMLTSRHQNTGQDHDTKRANRCFENVAQFRYLRTAVTNQNLIQEDIKERLLSDNACYHSVQKLLSSRPLSKNIKIKIYKTIILAVVLFGCETWSLALREEHRLRICENRVLTRIFGAKRDEVTAGWKKLRNEELHNLYSSPSVI
jgi:hypothetical protein